MGGDVARIRGKICVYRILVRKRKGEKPFESPGVDRRIILICIFRK